MRVHSHFFLTGVAATMVVALVGCSANPGPAPVEEAGASSETATSATAQPQQEEKLSEINIGIDPLGQGFNPHLIGDDSAFTRTLAGLVFPSAFDGQVLNTDLLLSAEVIGDGQSSDAGASASRPTAAETSLGVVDTPTAEPTSESTESSAAASTATPVATGAQTTSDNNNGASAGTTGTTGTAGTAGTTAGEVASAMTIRYTIRPEAQWSDGTPITVSDFEYLARQIVATPGAMDTALYREISMIRSADGGKTVEVGLKDKVANWQDLFRYLLPAHLLRGTGFATTLASSIPASAGRYSVARIDRQRGVVELNRNDRFWGDNPASIEVINFQEVRSVSQGVEMLSSGQVGFVDVTPTQTAHVAYDLLPGVQSRLQTQDRELAVTASAALTIEARRALLQAIDLPLVAKLATEREAELEVGQPLTGGEQTPLAQLFPNGVRLGVDPSDPTAARAATSLKNLFERAGVGVTEVETDTANLLSKEVATGAVDLVVAWEHTGDLSRYQCAESEAVVMSTESTSVQGSDGAPNEGGQSNAQAIFGTNFSGWCNPDTDAFIAATLKGEHSAEEAAQFAEALDRDQALRVWITRDTRLEVLGTSIVGPSPDLHSWPEAMNSVLSWRKNG